MAGGDPRPVGRARQLVAAVEATGAGAFIADTAPIIYRVERGADARLVATCDPLFDAVEAEELGCLVSTVSVAELLIEPFRAGPAAVSAVDAFLRQPSLGIVEVDEDVARSAAELVAREQVGRLPDALIAATGLRYGLPIVTGDRRLARGLGPSAFLVSDYG
jgi:predicted nucleic acid-binding protein